MIARRERWSPQAEARLLPALGPDRDAIRAMVQAGEARLWSFDAGRLYLVSRRDGAELVVMCMAGAGVLDAAPQIVTAAKRAGCTTIRFHTQRPALARMLNSYGFSERERIFAMEIQ